MNCKIKDINVWKVDGIIKDIALRKETKEHITD